MLRPITGYLDTEDPLEVPLVCKREASVEVGDELVTQSCIVVCDHAVIHPDENPDELGPKLEGIHAHVNDGTHEAVTDQER